MIIRVDIRGNGQQLSEYLVAMRENSRVEILEIDGYEADDSEYLHQTLMSMQFNAELTKTNVAYFNAQINPAYGEDKTMTREDWYKAADMLAEATGFENQRRVIILHTKKDRTHAHVVWERYNHETGKMIPHKNSKYKANDIRPKIEDTLGHKRTSHRNPHQPDIKIAVTKIWNETTTGPEFIKKTRKAGFIVASGTGNRPFMIVDENGRSFNLVRQIDSARTKDIRARLRHEKLVTDKQAIEIIREQQNGNSGKRESQKVELKPSAKIVAETFAENRNEATIESSENFNKRKIETAFNEFKNGGNDIATKQPAVDYKEQDRKQEIASQFADNKQNGIDQQAAQELERQKIIEEQERNRQRRLQRKPHR